MPTKIRARRGMTTKQILERDNYVCAYCGRRAHTKDHVVHKHRFRDPRLAERLGFAHDSDSNLVAACWQCNNRRGTRKLVPPSWEWRIPALNELFPGFQWQLWDGGRIPEVRR
jgi:5-methylcytosine-specific restriction endonuclease McrA